MTAILQSGTYPGFWEVDGTPTLLLGGSDEDNLFQYPTGLSPGGDLASHLDELVAAGGNYIRCTISTRDAASAGTDQYPWSWTGSEYDLDTFNANFFDRLNTLLTLCDERGIVVQIELFDGFDWTGSSTPDAWNDHPMNPDNNSDYTAAATGVPTTYTDSPSTAWNPVHTSVYNTDLTDPATIKGYLDAYVDRILDETLQFDNVLYIDGNEHSNPTAWTAYWADFVKTRAAAEVPAKTVYFGSMIDERPVDTTTAEVFYDLVNTNADLDFNDISQATHNDADDGANETEEPAVWYQVRAVIAHNGVNVRPLNVVKIYHPAATRSQASDNVGYKMAWRTFPRLIFAGTASARFHRATSDNIGLDTEAIARIKAVREADNVFGFIGSDEDGALISSATTEVRCRSRSDKVAVLFIDDGSCDVDLSSHANVNTVQWWDTHSGLLAKTEQVTGGGTVTLSTPSGGNADSDWIAVLTEQTITGGGTGGWQAQPVTGTIADTAYSSGDITLTTPVPVGKAFPDCSARGGDGADARDNAFRPILKTIVNGEYTEIEFVRNASATGALEIDGHVIWGDNLTVEMVTGTHTSGTGSTDSITITAVTLAESFIVGYSSGGGPAFGQCLLRFRFTSTTAVESYRGNTNGDTEYTIYVVSLDGATVQEELITIDELVNSGLYADAGITAVVLANTFFTYSMAYESSGTARHNVEVRLTSTTNVRASRATSSTPEHRVCVYIVEHADLSVEQSASKNIVGTSDTVTLSTSLADNGKRFLIRGNMLGNSQYSGTTGSEQDHGQTTHEFTAADTVTITRAASDDDVDVTIQAGTLIQATERLDPQLVSVTPSEAVDPVATSGSILVSRPSAELGTKYGEAILVQLSSQQRLRHSQMTVPTGFDYYVESPRPSPDDQEQPHELWYAMTGPADTEPEEWEFTTAETFESGSAALIQPTVYRYRFVDQGDPFGGGTATWDRAETAVGELTATAPAATADDEKSLRLVCAATRRVGEDWTFASELVQRSPLPGSSSLSGMGEEEVTGTTSMGTRDLGHDNHVNATTGYRWVAGSIFLYGIVDDGKPGAPEHVGSQPVSWETMKLVAARDATHPNTTTSIDVYRHTASMAGDPEANGTLVHTFTPDGTVVDVDGWSAETTYFVQFVARSALGSRLGEEFQVTMWRQAAHAVTTGQTLKVPMTIAAAGVTIADSESRDTNAHNDDSWSYTVPADTDLLLVFVRCFDSLEASSVADVTLGGVSMDTFSRTDQSAVSSAGGYICGGVFALASPSSGAQTLAVTWSGGTPTGGTGWAVYALQGTNISVRSAIVNATGIFDTTPLEVDVVNQLGDSLFDFLTWRNSAVDVAAIGANQTQRLSDDAPTRFNSTSRAGEGELGNVTTMSQTADENNASNVALYYGVAIRSDGGGDADMQGLRIDVGRAALNPSDLNSDPSLLVEVYDSNPTLIGSRTFTSLQLAEEGVQELVGTSLVQGPETIEIQLTNTGRTVAVWRLLGLEPTEVDQLVTVADVTAAQTDAATSEGEGPVPDAPTDLTATPDAGTTVDLAWTNADPTLQTRIYRRRI